jgi:hypothetical protein
VSVTTTSSVIGTTSFNIGIPTLPVTWPSETDLIFVLGTTKLMLSLQQQPLRTIIQEAFENMRAFLLFNHSFPDAATLLTVIRDCLVAATVDSQNPLALDIRNWLTQDDMYREKLSCLVRVLYC